ncbi:MAG: hypothetical protein ACXVVQ_06565 [Solirubrobacteraceae bacterium]
MGLLDDAIREHLDLKRRRGADPTEIERAERDALGPVRRDPVGSDEAALDHAALPDDNLVQEEGAGYDNDYEEPHGLEEPPQFAGAQAAEHLAAAEPPPPLDEYSLEQATEVWDEFEPDASGLVAPHEAHTPPPAPVEDEPLRSVDPLEEAPFEEEPRAEAPPEPYAAPAPPVEPYAPPEEPYSPPAAPEEPRQPEPPAVDPHATQPYTAEPTSPDPHPTAPHGDPLGSDTAEYDLELEEIEGDDVLEETPEFLQDTPDHDRLWFEQRPPKDFDFDE